MKDGGRRAFLAVLVAIFGLLLYLCVNGRQVIRWTAAIRMTRGRRWAS